MFVLYVPWCVSLWVCLYGTLFGLLDLGGYFLSHVREVLDYCLLKYLLMPFIFLFFLWDSCNSNIGALKVVQCFLRLLSFLLILSFSFLFYSASVISTILSSSSLIHSSASVGQLLVLYSVLLISVFALFITDCLFFNSSRSF